MFRFSIEEASSIQKLGELQPGFNVPAAFSLTQCSHDRTLDTQQHDYIYAQLQHSTVM